MPQQESAAVTHGVQVSNRAEKMPGSIQPIKVQVILGCCAHAIPECLRLLTLFKYKCSRVLSNIVASVQIKYTISGISRAPSTKNHVEATKHMGYRVREWDLAQLVSMPSWQCPP